MPLTVPRLICDRTYLLPNIENLAGRQGQKQAVGFPLSNSIRRERPSSAGTRIVRKVRTLVLDRLLTRRGAVLARGGVNTSVSNAVGISELLHLRKL